MSDKGITLIIQGTPISPGLAVGIIHVHRNRPQEKQKVIFRKKVDDKKHAHQLARERALKPAVTKDDVTISVLANVGCNADTEKAMLNGAEGVGLYRIGLAYLGRIVPPNTDELLNEMRQTLEAAKGLTVCVHLLDIGADKPFKGGPLSLIEKVSDNITRIIQQKRKKGTQEE